MGTVDWNEYAKRGLLAGVIDPADKYGYKNRLIDRIQWNVIEPYIRPGMKVLDFGCGTGRFYKRINDRGADYLGVDSSPGMVKAAREYNNTDSFEIGSVETCANLKKKFDLILSVWVLQYFFNANADTGFLKTFHDALNPASTFIALEQVSASGGTSSSVALSNTEDNYREILGKYFKKVDIVKVRAGAFSNGTYNFLEVSKRIPLIFTLLVDGFARREVKRIQTMEKGDLETLSYYDVLIVCKV